MTDIVAAIGCGFIFLIGALAIIATCFLSKMDDFQASLEEKANKLHQAQLKMLTTIETLEKIAGKIKHPSQHIPTQKEYDEAMKEAEGLNGKKK